MPNAQSAGREAQQRWRALGAMPDAELPLLEGAFLIAQDEYPELPVAEYLTRLEGIAAQVRRRLDDAAENPDPLTALNGVFFDGWGFRGNREDYYDDRNSYLNEVLDRRIGIPISLSVLYMDVARRSGLKADGIGVPGHFVVRLQSAAGQPLIIDPFNQGARLSPRRSGERSSRQDKIQETDLGRAKPADSRSILVRMLRNLKTIYLSRKDAQRALRTCDRIVALLPRRALEYRDRGLMYQELEVHHAAVEDFQRYLELAPAAADAGAIHERIVALHSRGQRLH